MNPARRAPSLAWAVILVAGFGSAGTLIVVLARQVLRSKEKTERFQTDQRNSQTQLATARQQLRQAREEADRLEGERRRRAVVVEAETAALRVQLAEAVRQKDVLEPKYRAAVGERDRATADLVAARREIEALRNDLAAAAQRASAAEGAVRGRAREAEEAARRLADLQARVESLLRPLLRDLRSADGPTRVRAHEALCAYAGRDLPFRPGGTAEEREADAAAIDAALLGDR